MKKLILIFLTTTSLYAGKVTHTQVDYLQFRVGHPVISLGPTGTMIDNFFNSVLLSNGTGFFLCFTANATSYRMTGTDPICTGATPIPVLGPVPNSYANCGLWINDTLLDLTNSNHLFAFAHAESNCNYAIGQTNKSMAVAQTFDGGLTWALTGQVIRGTDAPTPGKTTGEGDCTLLPDVDGFNYMYCGRASDFREIVARAPQSLPNGPWFKYYRGTWTQPGLGGQATALGAFGSASRWIDKDFIMLLAVPSGSSGITISLASDHVTFTALLDPLLITDNNSFVRTPTSSELIAYVSAVGQQGGRVWSSGSFTLTYLYLEPGADFGSRYLVSRNVIVIGDVPNPTGKDPQVGVELSRWLNSTSTTPEYWTTNAATPGAFKYQDSLGYTMTRKLTGTNVQATSLLEECVKTIGGVPDHLISPNGTCVPNGYTRLRTIGWLYTTEQPNTTALYSCFSPVKYKSHFASTNANCDGETTQFILGYILKT
jgi:hypothetical protein